MMAGKTQVLGIGQLMENFARLKRETDASAKRMVASAGNVLKKEARAIATRKGLQKSGALINNIVIKREKNAPDGVVQYHLGVRHGRQLGSGKRVQKYLALSRAGRIVTKRGNDPFYWRYLEFGTKGFKLNPRGKALRFKGGEGNVFAPAVSHPGVRPSPFLQPALENKSQEAIKAMERSLQRSVKRFGK